MQASTYNAPETLRIKQQSTTYTWGTIVSNQQAISSIDVALCMPRHAFCQNQSNKLIGRDKVAFFGFGGVRNMFSFCNFECSCFCFFEFCDGGTYFEAMCVFPTYFVIRFKSYFRLRPSFGTYSKATFFSLTYFGFLASYRKTHYLLGKLLFC